MLPEQDLSPAQWKSVIQMMDAPVALVRLDDTGVTRVMAVSVRFRELCASSGQETGQLLDGLGPDDFRNGTAFPGQPDWRLRARDLKDGLWLWEASARMPESAFEHLVRWTASAALGDLGVYLFDNEWRLRAYNGAIRRYFPEKPGFPLIGGTLDDQMKAIFDVYDLGRDNPEFREAWRSDVIAAITSPGAARLGFTPSGRWALITASRMEDGSHLVFMNDVTDFRERDQQLKLFMRNAKGILFSRRELKPGGELQVWGDRRALAESKPVKGRSEQHPAGWYDLIDERDRDLYMKIMEGIGPDEKPYVMEFRYRIPGSDKVRWMRENGWTIRDKNGDSFLDAIYFNITATKDAHLALSDSEERFRQFADLASDWYFETDADLRITFLSDRYERTSGTSNAHLIGRPYEEVVAMRTDGLSPELASAWHDMLAMWKRRVSFREHQMRFINNEGRMTTVSISGEPRLDENGHFLGYRGIGRDLTVLTEAQYSVLESLERAEKANAAKTTFIANVSHELRTPLNAIIGFSAIMSEGVLGPIENERYRQYASDINASGEHLLSLVNDLLDMAKLEAGQLSVEAEDVDVAEEVQQTLQMMSAQARERSITTALPADLPLLNADRRALRQIFINLISNAIKFTRPGGSVEVRGGAAPDQGFWLEFRDDGVGISDDQLEQIFEPFGRAKSDIAAEGTGLGLPLSRNLMRLHGGELELRSEPGKGTRARITFPPSRMAMQPADQRRITA